MLDLRAPDEREVLLVLPPFGVNTAEAYGWLAAARDAGYAAAPDATGVLDADALGDWATIARIATNEFEPRRRGAPSDDRARARDAARSSDVRPR